MKRWLYALVLFLALLGGIPGFAAEVVVVPVKGEISKAQFSFLRRALKEAAEENAKAVILDMDTPGGDLAATRQIQKELERSKLRTITYVNPNSASAGALIAISTKEIYMAPVSAIGAAAPVAAGGQDLPKTIQEKVVSFDSGYFRGVATKNGHNPDIAEAFMNKEKPVIVGGETIHEKGGPLTLSGQEAVRKIDGKPLLAVGIAESIPDLLKQAGLGDAATKRLEPTGFEFIAFWLTKLAPLFLLAAIAGAWLEIKTPGFGVPGIAAIICFILFFSSHYIAGLSGWEVSVIFALGLLLVLTELFILPGVILPGLTGVLLIFAAILLAMVDRYPGQEWNFALLEIPLLNLGIAVILAAALMALLAKTLPKTPLYRMLVLDTPKSPHASFSPEVSTLSERLPVGTQGAALSILRPSGRAEFHGEHFDVITRGEFVDPGTRLSVVSHEEGRIIVAPLPSNA